MQFRLFTLLATTTLAALGVAIHADENRGWMQVVTGTSQACALDW